MNISEIKKALPVLTAKKVVAFLWGPQGVGKTETVRQVANELGIGFVHLHLATQEVGDLVGLLVHKDDGSVEHARPEWFPTEGRGILFLDELNRAHPDVIQSAFSLVTEGTIHRHKLPAGWAIVAAGNYQTNQFNVTDTSDAAWMSRFCHIDFQPSKEEFVHFATKIGCDSVADFIGARGELLESEVKERFNFQAVTPDRRSWINMVGRLEDEYGIEDMRFELYKGIVGPVAAAAFLQHKKQASERISGKQILKCYQKVRSKVLEASDAKETRFDKLNSAFEEILLSINERQLSDLEVTNFQNYLLDVPLELGLKIINKLHDANWSQRNAILNNAEFVERFKTSKLRKVG